MPHKHITDVDMSTFTPTFIHHTYKIMNRHPLFCSRLNRYCHSLEFVTVNIKLAAALKPKIWYPSPLILTTMDFIRITGARD